MGTEPAAGLSVGPRRILIVEDERIIALDLGAALEELGYQVAGMAGSCEEAIQKAAEVKPELALMDIRIRGALDGIDTAAKLRELHQLAIVYLTANADHATLTRAMETEPGGYLAKPFNARSLHATIQVALRRHDAERSLRESNTRERRRFEQQSLALLALSERLSEEANTDPLTQLYNRRYLDKVVPGQLELAEREGHSIGVILLDVDRFKQVNDQYGHATGDQALREIAAYLRQRLRSHDVACRYGGEEIAIIAPGAGLHDAVQLAERLRKGIEKLAVRAADESLSVTTSFGVSAFPVHGLAASQLLQAADSALYEAKRAGRNRVSVAVV
jgi:diguanylate cyclase (GGDEF)-like protein